VVGNVLIFLNADQFGVLVKSRGNCRDVSLIIETNSIVVLQRVMRTNMEVSVAGNKLQLDASIDVRTENKKGRGKKITGLHVR